LLTNVTTMICAPHIQQGVCEAKKRDRTGRSQRKGE